VRRQAAGDAIAMALQTLVGIGPVIALTLRAEIGAIDQFPHWSRLASYAGLVPRIEMSAPAIPGKGPSPGRGRRGGEGRWSKRRSTR
jgi:transposase